MDPTFDALYLACLIAAFALCCGVVLLIALRTESRPFDDVLMVATIILLIVAGRWPSILMPGPLNPDESMMLAQAMKFDTDLVPWRAIDTGTGGPINSYLLLVGHWLGASFGYPLARMTAIGCLVVTLCLSYLTLRRIGSTKAAAIAVLPACAFLATATQNDFLHYSSELASLAAIAFLAFVASGFSRKVIEWRRDVIRGLLVGCCAFLVAMAKVQGVPLGASVAICVLALTAGTVATFARRIVLVVVGGALATAALVALLWSTHVLGDFWASFVELPRTYAVNPQLSFDQTKNFILETPEARSFVQAAAWLLVIVIALSPFVPRLSLKAMLFRAPLQLLVLATIFVTLSQPGRTFPHYLNYLAIAATWTLFLAMPWHVAPSTAKESDDAE